MKQAPEIKIPYIKYLKSLVHDPISLRTQIFQEYGNIAWKKVKGVTTYNVFHPEYVKYILEDNQDNFLHKHPATQHAFCPVIGNNSLLATNDLKQWDRDRNVAERSFHPDIHFEDYADTIAKLCHNMIEEWRIKYKNDEYINVHKEIGILILSIINQTIFNNVTDPEVLFRSINEVAELVKKKMTTLPFLWRFSPKKKDYEAEVDFERTLSKLIVKERLQSKNHWDDLLGDFIHDYKDIPEDDMIRLIGNHVGTFFSVGYLTTTGFIEWLLVELSRQPELERRIAEEVDQVVGSRLPTYADIPSLKYLSAVIKEVLRIHPPAFVSLRQSISDDSIDGMFIPAKAGIAVSIYHIHRHPDFWENPEGFDPSRFYEESSAISHPYAFIPFSANKRKCLGAGFSVFEATLIVATLVQQLRLHLPAHQTIKPFYTTLLSMRPDINDMRLQFKLK